MARRNHFLLNRKVKLVINGYVNLEKEVNTGIPQGSPVFPILFLIYISGVFDTVTTTSPNMISLSFIDDLGFLVDGKSIHEVAADSEKIGEVVLRWGHQTRLHMTLPKPKQYCFQKTEGAEL